MMMMTAKMLMAGNGTCMLRCSLRLVQHVQHLDLILVQMQSHLLPRGHLVQQCYSSSLMRALC